MQKNRSMKNIYLILAVIIISLINSPANAQTPQPIAYYPLNGNFNDAAGNGHNCVENNLSYAYNRNNIPNAACNFNGSNSYAKTPNSSDFDFGGNDSFSVTFWIKPFAGGSYPTILSKCEQSDTSGYAIGFDNTNRLRVITNLNFSVFSSFPLTMNQWQHVAVTYANKSITIYINGYLDNSGSVPSLNRNAYGLVFGKLCQTLCGNYYSGLLDELRIYKSMLTSTQIGTIYSTGIKKGQKNGSIFDVYPTFVSGIKSIKIKSGDMLNYDVQLTNNLGQIISEGKNVAEINTENIQNGIYYLQIRFSDINIPSTQVNKVIISK